MLLLSSKGMTSFAMPPDEGLRNPDENDGSQFNFGGIGLDNDMRIESSAAKSWFSETGTPVNSKAKMQNAAAKGRLNAYLLTRRSAIVALNRCQQFMRDDPVAAGMLIRDHSGQLARDLIGSGLAANDWVSNNILLMVDQSPESLKQVVLPSIDVALSKGE